MLHAPYEAHEVATLTERCERLENENQTLRERVSDLTDEKYRVEYFLREYGFTWVFES